MKQVTFIFIMIVNSILIKAQEENQLTKGHFFLGGGFDLEYDKNNEGEKITSIETSPNGAIFLFDNLAVGIQFNTMLTLTKGITLNGNSYILRESTNSITPFVRYYLFSYLFSEAGIGYELYWWNHDSGDKTKFRGFTGSINLGYSLFLNEHIAIEPIISYSFEYIKNINEVPYDRKTNILDFCIKINSFF